MGYIPLRVDLGVSDQILHLVLQLSADLLLLEQQFLFVLHDHVLRFNELLLLR